MSAARIALFRGINVGGHKKVPMADLRKALEEAGLEKVGTHVQSGNVVFAGSGKVTAATIEKVFAQAFGFSASIFLFTVADWARLIAANPFPKAAGAPKTLHLFVMGEKPAAERIAALDEKLEKLSGVQAEDEYMLKGKALYLHVPNGLGRSKLAELVTRTLKVEMTGRNWRTVLTLKEMADAID